MSEGNRESRYWRMPIAIAAVLLLLTAGLALAQQQTGNLFGTVSDEHGAPLPGVTLTLSGQGAPMVTTTDAKGNYHFLGLSPGTYDLKAELQGFSTLEQSNVGVSINRSTTVNVTLQGAIQQTITVTSQTPALDTRKVTTGVTVSSVDLKKIPNTGDPWAILQQTPGVQTDRINVGGSQSGQQSNYVGNGSMSDQSTWYVDGVEITDIGALGSSPTYYDLGAVSEMDMATGGSDTNLATPGVAINMVTKRGTNQWRGSAHYIIDKNSWQSS
ncbi:MAG TPA: carboxypeptidase regulatory-like domain-containing protein, partial [Thermoanaerobaculia bacterium]|nr:carboxypeptidase regulatory-like domain-containing protein [Thermoanaerobaculia bacterium]